MSARLTEEEYANLLVRRKRVPLSEPGAVATGKGQVPRRTPGQMNGLEKSYAETILTPRKLAGEIIEWWFEAITLKLADDCRYTPDFLVMLADHSLECHETKGFMRDDAQIKLKLAAQTFPFRFLLCKKQTKKQGGQWVITEAK